MFDLCFCFHSLCDNLLSFLHLHCIFDVCEFMVVCVCVRVYAAQLHKSTDEKFHIVGVSVKHTNTFSF